MHIPTTQWTSHHISSNCREIKPVNPKGNQPWVLIGRTDAEATILWPPDAKSRLIGKDWCWERLRAGGEGDDRGWDSWMASPTRWTWVWASFGSWWWTGRPGVFQSMGSQRAGHNWATEVNWTETSSSDPIKEVSKLRLPGQCGLLLSFVWMQAKNHFHIFSNDCGENFF